MSLLKLKPFDLGIKVEFFLLGFIKQLHIITKCYFTCLQCMLQAGQNFANNKRQTTARKNCVDSDRLIMKIGFSL